MPYNPLYDGLFVQDNPPIINPKTLTGLGYNLYPNMITPPSEESTSGIIFGESDYDLPPLSPEEITNTSYINRNRANQEPEYVKGFNSIVGGVASGLATAVQDVSYLLDIDNGIKRLTGAEEVEENAIGQLMRDFKQGLATTMPIYKEDPNKVWSWSDSGSYWEALKGVIDSAVGFGLPGLGAAKLVGSAVKAARVNALLQGMLTANRAEALTSIGAGFLTNYAEGKTMAIEAYENSMKNLKSNYYDGILKKYVDQGLDPGQAMQLANEEYEAGLKNGKEAEFSKIAGNEADKFQRNNMVFMLTDALGLHGILKGTKGLTRNIITKESMKNYFLGANADNFLVQGVKEGAEEIGQNMMQSEAEYQAAEKGGIDTGEPSDFTQRMIKFGTDDKALLEGAMGFFGGPAQRVLMSTLSGKYSSSYKKSIQDQIDKQDTQLKENEATLNSILNTQAKASDLKAEALMNGDTKSVELIDKTSFALLAANNFVNGTTERLERSLYDILDMDEEQANKEGYTPDYKEKAQSMLEDLKVLEKEWIGISGYSTASPLFMKMQDAKYLRSIRENLMQEKDKESTNLKNYLLKNHGEEANKGKIPVATFKPTGTLTFDEINEIATTGNTSSEREDMLDFEYIKSLPEYQNFSKALNRLNIADEALGKTIDDIKYYKSNEGIREYKESIKNAKKLIEEVEKAKKISKKKESERSKRKEDASKTKKESEGKPNESANPVITPETTDVVPGDFDDLMDNPPITEGINPTEDLIGNSVSPELNKELQKEATASNEELEKSFKDNQELKKELQEGVVTEKIGSEELNDGDIESKKADIERRRQEELKPYDERDSRSLEAITPNNPNHPTFYVGKRYNEGDKIIVESVEDHRTKEEEGYNVIVSVRSPAEFDNQGKMIKKAIVKVAIFDSKSAADKAIQDKFEKVKSKVGEKQKGINAKYDAELALLEQSHTTPTEVASKLEEDEAKINDTGYNSNTYQEVIDESNSVESTIEDSSRAIVKPDGSIVYDYDRINQGNNVVAFLSRAYEDIVTFVKNIVSISRQDLDNKLNESSKNALRYKNNKPGTKLKFVVEDNPDAVVYIKDSQETTTWGAVSAGLDKSSDEFIMQVPIAIYNEAGDKIGYVHNKDWITEKHVSGDLNTDMEALSKTRKAILNGKVNGIITGNNAGMFFRTRGNQLVAVSKAMPDPKLELVVSKNGLPYTNRNTTSNKTPINKLKDGLLYAIVPYGDKHVALPLMVGNINENHARALIKAITIYATNDTKNPFREYVLKTLKLDITTPAGINEFLKIYVNDTSLNGNIVPGNTNAFRFHVSKGKIYFARGGTDITKAPYIAQSGDTNSMAFRELMNLISNNIRTLYYNVSLDKLDSGNIISLDADGNASESNYRDHIKDNSYSNILGFNVGTESDPEYTYTLQPSITFSIDSKEDTTKPSKEENKVVTKPVNVSTTDKEKPVKKALPSKLIKKINTDDDITSDALLSSNTKKALENNSKNVYSPKLGAKIQNGVVNYIIGRVIDKAFSSMDLADRAESKKLDITGELESIKNEYIKERDEALANVEELTKLLGDEEYNQEDIVSAIESNKYYAAMANTVIEEWKVMTRLAQEGIFKLNNAKFDTLSEESIDTELEDNGESPERAFDSSQLTFDTLNKLSVKVKRLFGGIKKVKNNGEPLLNAFNQEMSMPFDEVYNTLQSLTTNLKPSYEVMKAKMLASKEKFPWITQVIDKLDAADELTRNSFVTGMSNHSRDMKFYMWARDKNGKFTLSEYDANANSVTQILLNTWANNIMYNINSEISKQMVIGDSVVIAGNPEVIDLVQAQFEKFRTNPSKVTTEELSQWLKSIGIELSTKSIEYIRNNMVASKNWNANFSSRSGIFNIINSNLGKLKNDNIDGSDFLKDSALKELARIEATFSKDVLPTSFRAGKKSVFSYGNNNLLVDSIRRLKEYNTLEDGTFTSDVLTELMSTSFTRESYWLKSMLVYDAEGKPLKGTDGKYRIDPNSSGYANLNHAVMSLEAIKEIKTKSRDNRELHKLSPAEVELVKIAMLQSVTSDLSGKNQRRIKVTFPTTSDKTTVMMLSTIAFDIKYNTDGTIDDNTLNRLYDIFVLPELYRITNYQANGKKLNVDAYNDGADKFLLFPEFNNIDGLFDEDGNISLEAYNDAFKSKFKDLINKYIEELVADKLSNWNTYGIGLSSKPGDEKPYTNAFLDAKFMDNITTKGVAKENAVKAAATDMVVQYLVSNVEAMKMFIGDPAQFWKAKPTDDIITATRKLYDNVGKRLAGDIAPGTTLAESEGNTYIQLFAKDVETPSKELDDRLFMYLSPEDLKAYKKMNSADAQEYTTWKEHLDVLFMLGKITQQDKDTITSIINRYVDKKSKNLPIEKEDRLTKDQIHMVLQPMKPVYVNTSVYEGDYDFRRRVYIKSSSFPLIPELTDGLEIDNLRVAMEELETSTNKGVRLAYASAAKIGAVSSKATIFKNGRFVKGLKFTEDNYLVLDRKGFRIQQEIPYDPNKQEIREVTQASKNLFLDVLDVDGFKLPNDNTEYSGKQLYNKFVEAHSKLYTTSKMLLLNRILNKDGKTINIPELRELLKEESLKRNYNISDRLLIDLDKDLEFLPYSAIESKYQAVLNAIVYNNIVKQKIHGKSFVLGSQVGFKQTEVISSAKGISGIIFTEEFDSEIKPMHIVNGELKPNQVILPWKFRDNYGNILDINNFTKVVNDRVVIDTTKLPKELLLGFGMRIPNQAQNSQAVFEIVGFLPESMQDLIIAPEEFTIQMGSDFDVDKLYTYTYNTWYNNKTKELSKISLSDSEIRELYYKRRDKDENVDRLLEALFGENATEAINYDYELFAAAIKMLEYQNELVDIHIASHMNPHPKVQEAISKPLDNWIIEDVAAEVNKARISRESNRMFAPMSESYQTKKFMQATAGKAGVGIFSLDSMFNALAQTVNTLEFNSTDNKGNEILKPIAFGNVVSDFKLNRINTLDNKYTISKVISGYQSASVDNEKLQVLDKLNINSETFEVIKLLNQLGFGEEVLWFISQDIIFDYVNEVIRLKGTLGEFVKDAKILAFMNTLINKYGYTKEGIQSLVEFGEGSTLYNPSLDDMKSLVKYSKDSVPSNFKEAQAHILLKFMNLQSLAKDLSTLERGINLDSKGFGASLFDSIEKEESIIKSISSNNIKGASSLFGDVVINPKAEAISELESNGYVLLEYNNSNLNIYIKPTTIPGLALVHGLDVNNSLWREISPIASQRFQTISKRMAVLTTADTRSNKAEFNKEVWDGVRSFIFANSNWNDSLNNTSERREILLTDKESEVISNINGVDTKVKIKTSKSLGTILNEIKNTPLFRSNAFLRRLEVIPQTTNGTTIYTIQYRAGIKEGVNDTEIYTDFLGLLLNEVKITDNNNKEYTTTDLAQDLIEYSFITGGIQGATEFIKLIPPAYLHSIGMFKYVNDFFYEDSTLLPLTDLYAFNRFELEFIRNNPGLVKPKVNTSDEEFKSFKPIYDDSKRLQAFTIPFVDNNGNSNTGLIARYTTLNEGNVVPVPFITIRNYNSPSGYDLYYFDGQSQYLYISTLGNKNISEYNSVGAGLFNSTYKPVIMPDVDKPITNIAAPTINSKSIFDSTTISIAYDNLLKHLDGNELQGKEGVKALLDLLAYSSSTDAVDSSIISIMSNNLHKLPDNIKIVFNLDEASDKEGMFVYDLNNNNINTLFFKDTLLGQLATKDGIDYALPIILHELYHAFTSRLITKFSKGEKIEDDNLRKILVSLESSRRQYKEHLSNKYPEEFKEFNIKYSKFTGGDKTITFSDREIAIFYPSVSLKEFTAQTTSAEDFMNELNMIYSDNSTLLSKVFDSLSKLLSYIFGVDNNTLFYKSLTESLELINPELDTTQAIEDNINTSNLQISEKENNKIPKATGLMKFSYGNNKRADVTSLTTLEAIKKGERTATTRYESDGNINYWKNLKVGDIIEWEGQNSEKVLVEVTKPLHKLRGSGKTAEQWSKLEGWSVDYFNSKVKPRLDEAWQMEFKPISDQTINTSNSNYKWARYSNNSYEVSSQGDKRFSALFAKLKDGRTIEEAYQLDVKGYRSKGNDWKLGKGKAPIKNISKEQSWEEYKQLWRIYLNENPELLKDLQEKAKGKVLTDKFATTDISQARALAEILNEKSTVNTSTLQKRNVFTINPTKAIDKKASVKASVANKFIGYGEGIEGSSTENYRKQAGEYANTGNYSSNDVVFVSIGGKRPANNLELRKSQQDRTIKEAIKAIEAGATLITDNVNYIHYNSITKQQRPITMSVEEFRKEDGLYNEGEKRLYENLKVKGYNYSEQTVDGEVLGVWTNSSTTNAVVEEKLSKPSVIESYTEFGTTYKFELVDGEIVKATYTQGYSSNELELSPKNWYKVYNRLKNTPKQEEVKPTSPPKKSNTTFTFSDGITVDTDFELNSEQAIALQKMADFFNKPNSVGLKDNSFILSGYAGTGKTSIIKYLVKYIREDNRRKGKYQTIVFSSPTHRANMQLKKNTKETVNTMHSLFGLSPDLEIENLDYNDLKFITIADPKFEPEDILIVDESSMISAAMLKIMEDLVESFGSTSTKVIFMGDKAQLGPVKDHKQSPVFDLVNKADLTKVERTKDSPLLDEITHIRNAKQDEKPYTYSSTQNANGNGVTFVTKRNQFLESIAKAFLSTEFKNDKLAYRALAFTNEEVKEINTSVRNAMFGNDAVNQYQKGELVMAYANRFKSMRTKEFMYMNGTDYIVTQSSNGVKEYNGIQYNGVNVTLQSEYDPDIIVSTFVIITENNSITNLKALSSYLESLRLAAVRALGSSKGVLWKEYYNNFNSFVVNSNVTEINPVTGKSKVLIPKGIDYGYAHTIHKSQGGEYKQVFINDADISRSPDENMKSQLRYVAASRAKEHATIFYSNTISKEKITNFEEDSTTPDYRDFSMPLSDIPDIPDHILDNPDYDPNKIMNDYNSRIDNIDFDNDINTFNDINPSPEDSYHSDLLLKGYITRDDIERLKKICK